MGSGFKDWAAGDVLTAADVDGYLMRQTVMTFADASARDTALSGVLDEGMVAYLEDTDYLTVYDGSNWVIYSSATDNVQQTVVDSSVSTSVAANSFGAVSGFTVSITPKVSTHKVLVIAHINGTQVSGNVTRIGFRFTRGGSPIGTAAAASNRSLLTAQNIPLGTNAEQSTSVSMMYLDSPATTSATTYGIDVFNYDAGNTRSVGLNAMNNDNDFAYVTRTISTITAIEVRA